MQTLEELLKTLVHPRPDGVDPKIQMEYDQVNENFRMLADIRFKLLALVPPLGGVAIFALSKMAGPEDLKPSQYALALLVSVLGFLATLGITFYDQRNSELYNALGGRANHLEYRAGLDANPNVQPSKEKLAGQFLERPKPTRRLIGIPFLLMKHDRGLAMIYGSVLGAWFFPIVYASLGWAQVSDHVRAWVAIGVAGAMVIIFIAELLRLDGTFSESTWGTVRFYNHVAGVIQLDCTVRDRTDTFSGELLSRCRIHMKDDSERQLNEVTHIPKGLPVSLRYKTHRLSEISNPALSSAGQLPPDTPRTVRAHRVIRLKFLADLPNETGPEQVAPKPTSTS